VDSVPDPLLLRISGSDWNRTRTSGSVARNSNHLTTEAFYTYTQTFFKMYSNVPKYVSDYVHNNLGTDPCHMSSITWKVWTMLPHASDSLTSWEWGWQKCNLRLLLVSEPPLANYCWFHCGSHFSNRSDGGLTGRRPQGDQLLVMRKDLSPANDFLNCCITKLLLCKAC
jgi:hypothetical protein